jgi:hypothetical protein
LPVKRKAFFSFNFADVIRVNNVRLEVPGGESTFYDSSLWERKKLTDPNAIKKLIRDGIDNTSVVCSLAGTHTWERRWCRYEIAIGVAEGKGLLSVDINGLRHHQDKVAHPRGPNPLAQMAVGNMGNGRFRLYEYKLIDRGGYSEPGWVLYEDYTWLVDLPPFLAKPDVGFVMPLDSGTFWYDYVAEDGSKNLGSWLDLAARRAGR